MKKPTKPLCIAEDKELLFDEDDLEYIDGSVSTCNELDESMGLLEEDIEHQKVVEHALEGDAEAIIKVYQCLSAHLLSGKYLPSPYKSYFSFITGELSMSKDCRVLVGFDPYRKPGPKENVYRKMLIAQLVLFYNKTKQMHIYKEAIPALAMRIGLGEKAVTQAYEKYHKQITRKALYNHSFKKEGVGFSEFSEDYIEPLVEKIRQNTVTIFDVYPIS